MFSAEQRTSHRWHRFDLFAEHLTKPSRSTASGPKPSRRPIDVETVEQALTEICDQLSSCDYFYSIAPLTSMIKQMAQSSRVELLYRRGGDPLMLRLYQGSSKSRPEQHRLTQVMVLCPFTRRYTHTL